MMEQVIPGESKRQAAPQLVAVTPRATVTVALKDRASADLVADWLNTRSDLHCCRLILLHVAEPEWLFDLPDSSIAGQRMLRAVQGRIEQMNAAMDVCANKLRRQFPDLSVEYRIHTGSALSLLMRWVRDSKTSLLVVFNTEPTRQIFNRDFTESLKSESPCPVVVVPRRFGTND